MKRLHKCNTSKMSNGLGLSCPFAVSKRTVNAWPNDYSLWWSCSYGVVGRFVLQVDSHDFQIRPEFCIKIEGKSLTCEQALPGGGGMGRWREGKKESLHTRLINVHICVQRLDAKCSLADMMRQWRNQYIWIPMYLNGRHSNRNDKNENNNIAYDKVFNNRRKAK